MAVIEGDRVPTRKPVPKAKRPKGGAGSSSSTPSPSSSAAPTSSSASNSSAAPTSGGASSSASGSSGAKTSSSSGSSASSSSGSTPALSGATLSLADDYALGEIDFSQAAFAVEAGVEVDHEPEIDEEAVAEADDSAENPEAGGVEVDEQAVAEADDSAENPEADGVDVDEEAGAEAEADGDTQYVEIDGQLVHPSDVLLYNLGEQARQNAQPDAPEVGEVWAAGEPGNPFAAENATAVEVTPWDGLEGEQNDHIEGILLGQGYELDEIYGVDGQPGLLDQVAEVNQLADPDLIEVGQTLVVPTTAAVTTHQEYLVADGDRVQSLGTDRDDDLFAEGGGQDDTIVLGGGEGFDYIAASGGGGDDRITVEGGDDEDFIEIDGGAGDDLLEVRLQGDGLDGPHDDGYDNDEGIVIGGEGRDVLNISGDGEGSIVFDQETGVSTVRFEDGSRVTLDGVEEVNITSADGETRTFALANDGSFIDPNAPAIPAEVDPDAPAIDSDAPAEPEQARRDELNQALDVVDSELDNLANPSYSDSSDSGFTVSGLESLTREEGVNAFVDILTAAGVSDEEAVQRAEALQAAATTILDHPDLISVIDGGAYEGGEDGFFVREDLNVARAALDPEAQQAYQTIVDFRPAFQAATANVSDDAVDNPHPVFDSDLEAVLEIGDALFDGQTLDDVFADEALGQTALNIFQNLPPESDATEALLQMAEAADFLLHQQVAADLGEPLTHLDLAAALADYDLLANLDSAA